MCLSYPTHAGVHDANSVSANVVVHLNSPLRPPREHRIGCRYPAPRRCGTYTFRYNALDIQAGLLLQDRGNRVWYAHTGLWLLGLFRANRPRRDLLLPQSEAAISSTNSSV